MTGRRSHNTEWTLSTGDYNPRKCAAGAYIPYDPGGKSPVAPDPTSSRYNYEITKPSRYKPGRGQPFFFTKKNAKTEFAGAPLLGDTIRENESIIKARQAVLPQEL